LQFRRTHRTHAEYEGNSSISGGHRKGYD
jgi:hypothetical protein